MMALPRVLRLRQVFVVCVIITTILATLYLQQTQLTWMNQDNVAAPPNHVLNHPYFNYSLAQSEPVPDAGQACRIPRVHPFHPSIWKHFPPSKPIVCKARQPSLTYVNHTGHLNYNATALIQSGYGSEGHPSVDCSFTPVLRETDDDFGFKYGPEIHLPPTGILLQHDHILVRCTANSFFGLVPVEVYSAFHVNARPLPKKTLSVRAAPFNVVIFGVDSLSRLAFMRFLPLTYRYLTEKMGAYVLRGMNKVADNTFPNLVAILTGQKAYGELPMPPVIEHYDSWPLVWKQYDKIGYSTLFAEDYPDYNMFTYLSTGFKTQPTDHYLRPFWLAVKSSSQLRYSGHLCLGTKPRHQYQIDHLLSFMRRNNSNPIFAFSFLAEVTHEYLSRASAADSDFENFLKSIVEDDLLGQNTFFVFMSDHGHRFDAIRGTPVGRLEERMPFMAVVPPKSMSNEYLINLNRNTAKLTSPYDHHATLLDIISHVTNDSQLGTTVTRYGRSLFGPIPSNRTCEQAGIPEFYCVCGTDVDAPLSLNPDESSRLADSAGRAVVDRVNALLGRNHDSKVKCATLKLKEVKSLQRIGDGPKMTVSLEVEPSNALFETNVRLNNSNFEVLGEISRINLYRGQSDCIANAILRKYCYCLV